MSNPELLGSWDIEHENLRKVLNDIYNIHAAARGYGRSWCKRGEARGIIPNIDRKHDRLDGFFKDADSPPKQGEKKIDTIADYCVYVSLYLGWLMEVCPEEYKSWAEKMFDGTVKYDEIIEGDEHHLWNLPTDPNDAAV